MKISNLDLFAWWAISISGGIAFLILVSIYLYAKSRSNSTENRKPKMGITIVKDFVFVWVLIGLLIFYIASVNIGSAIIFAAGNIIVESILILYLIRNRQEKSKKAPRPRVR